MKSAVVIGRVAAPRSLGLGVCASLLLASLSFACRDAQLEMGEEEGLRQDHNRENGLDAGGSIPPHVDAAVAHDEKTTASTTVRADASAPHPAADDSGQPTPAPRATGETSELASASPDEDGGADVEPPRGPDVDVASPTETEPGKPPLVPSVVGSDPPDAGAAPDEVDGGSPAFQSFLDHMPGCSPGLSVAVDYCDAYVTCGATSVATYCENSGAYWTCSTQVTTENQYTSNVQRVFGENAVAEEVCNQLVKVHEPGQQELESVNYCFEDEGCVEGLCSWIDGCGSLPLGPGLELAPGNSRTVSCSSSPHTLPSPGNTTCNCMGFGENDSYYYPEVAALDQATGLIQEYCASPRTPPPLDDIRCEEPRTTLGQTQCSFDVHCAVPFEYAGIGILEEHAIWGECSLGDETVQCHAGDNGVNAYYSVDGSIDEACATAFELRKSNELVVGTATHCVPGSDFAADLQACTATVDCRTEASLGDTPAEAQTLEYVQCSTVDDGYVCYLGGDLIQTEIVADSLAAACEAAQEYGSEALSTP